MLSISSGHSADYLTGQVAAGRESYYTGAVTAGEPPGRWAGRGAERLGLSGLVDAQDMTALYEYRLDPRDVLFRQPAEWGRAATLGGPLRTYASADELYERALATEPYAGPERREVLRVNAERTARSNVQFLDATFSAPKSVTILAVAFERQAVEAERVGDGEAATAWRAHRDAVEAAVLAGNQAMLDYLQDVAGYSRVGHHGGEAGRFVDAHDWVVASFLQHDSRDHDPQLHVHNAILNRVQSADGKWRTLATRALYAHRGAAGALAERVMEEHLTQSLGLRFATRPDGKAREVLGVRPEVMELFSSRRRRITPKVAELVARFEDRFGRQPNSLELARLSLRATLATRRAKSYAGETAEERLDRWDAQLRAEVADGLAGVARDVLGLVDEPRETVRWSPAVVVETALAEVQAVRPTWTAGDLTAAIGRGLPDELGGLSPDEVRQLLDGLTVQGLAVDGVEQIAGERIADLPTVPELLVANGDSAYQDPVGRRYALRGQLVTEHALRKAAIEIGAPAVELNAAEAATDRLADSGLVLSADQRQALVGVLSSGAKIETLVGPAGAGKSTVVGGLARIWGSAATWPSQPEPPRVVGLAASQVATDVLAGEGLSARNVTRWLQTQARLADGSWSTVDADWRLAAGDLVIVDEAAMLTTADLAAIHGRVDSVGAKLLLTGDHRQLAAVGAGGGMAMLARAGSHELTEVRRFTADWEGPASLRLRDGDEAALYDYRKRGRLIDGGTPQEARTSAARAWLADTLAGRRSVLVVGSNEEAARLSAEVRAALVRFGRVEEAGVPLGREGTVAGVGDLVQARRNGWELAGFAGNASAPINRQTYRVVGTLDDGGLVVESLDASEFLTLPGSYVAADVVLGYAGTAHSTQGRTVDTSHAVVGAGTATEALYVGLTRGREGNHAHVVTRPDDEQQPTGAVGRVSRGDPLSVLVGVVRSDADVAATRAAALEQLEAESATRRSVQTKIERFAAEAEMVYAARTAAALDRLTTTGALTAEQRSAFAAEATDLRAVARLLRSAELAGHDPDEVLASAITSRTFDGARSLPQVVYGRIKHRLEGRLAPADASFRDMVPAVTSAAWRERLRTYAEAADARRHELGAAALMDPPQWAVERLGSLPADPLGRADWEYRAGVVSAWRELAGHDDSADALGAAPRPGKPEHYALWQAAWTALGRPDAQRAEAELSDGQLRLRVRAQEREESWAPPYVGESLTAASLAAGARRRDAILLAARADAEEVGSHADSLARESADAAAVADVLDRRVIQLEEADRARARWLVHTAVTRDAADRALAELATRGAPVGSDADDAVTAAEWLAAHHAEQIEADKHRPITAEHDLTGAERTDLATVDDAYVETGVEDSDAGQFGSFRDELGRIPTADESESAVRRAQAALARIEQRRTLDDRQAEDERRAQELSRWAADDDAATTAAGLSWNVQV